MALGDDAERCTEFRTDQIIGVLVASLKNTHPDERSPASRGRRLQAREGLLNVAGLDLPGDFPQAKLTLGHLWVDAPQGGVGTSPTGSEPTGDPGLHRSSGFSVRETPEVVAAGWSVLFARSYRFGVTLW